MGQESPDEERVLLTLLDERAAAGDVVSGQAAQALRRREPGFTRDAMAVALDRLVQLVREQETQIVSLRAMLETQL